MAEIDLEELSNLYATLTALSRTLLNELNQFQEYLATHPASPEIALTKFLTDVTRENNLLTYHGAALGLITPEAPIEQSTYTNAPLRTSLARVQKSDISPSNSIHRIRSSNIGFLSAVWAEMKRSHGLVAVRKQVRYLPDTQTLGPVGSRGSQDTRERERQQRRDSLNRDRQGMGGSMAKVPRRVRGSDGIVRRADKDPVTVDVVSEHGARWVKIVTKNTGWLLMDLAKEGLVEFGRCEEDVSTEEGEEANGKNENRNDGLAALDELKLCRTAKEFLAAAKTARVGSGHEHPNVHFYLTKIERGVSRDVDAVLKRIEDFGIVVKTAKEFDFFENGGPTQKESTKRDDSALTSMFERMTAGSNPQEYTSTLNIDCTILIALISDISHQDRSNIAVPSHYDGRQAGKDIDYQLKTEPDDPLLPNNIYPILRGKRLVCTDKAATHLRNIVHIMGSETETKRSNLFLPIGPEDHRESKDLRCALQKVSIHDVPEDLQLPIEIVGATTLDDAVPTGTHGASLEKQVRERLATHPRLSPLNQSVFFHGWCSGTTTVSLNRVVSEWLDRAIDATLDDIEREENASQDIAVERGFAGPQVLICGRERSLLGNEK